MFGDPNLPDGSVPHLLKAEPSERAVLRRVFQKFKDVFPASLPAQAPPDRGLGDAHVIPLIDNAKPAAKKMYRHSPQE